MNDEEMIKEFLNKNESKKVEIETVEEVKHKQNLPTMNELFVLKNIFVKVKNGVRVEPSFDDHAFSTVKKIKPDDKLNVINKIFRLSQFKFYDKNSIDYHNRSDKIKVVDFDIYQSEKTGQGVYRYLLSNGKKITEGQMKNILNPKKKPKTPNANRLAIAKEFDVNSLVNEACVLYKEYGQDRTRDINNLLNKALLLDPRNKKILNNKAYYALNNKNNQQFIEAIQKLGIIAPEEIDIISKKIGFMQKFKDNSNFDIFLFTKLVFKKSTNSMVMTERRWLM
ncbi:MAG: hypothetical protein COB67_02525 [SAR324 cluster bacterium]|uniref:Tetratricopeptide repeat protein n=1 Tax=SAR324 cluster bacterium TaxID=2024889 RepID=A0A2A4T982_9DELT|nr:MAG: hypothetical protein COB67_02525 [SAR324 cluster bacterium]